MARVAFRNRLERSRRERTSKARSLPRNRGRPWSGVRLATRGAIAWPVTLRRRTNTRSNSLVRAKREENRRAAASGLGSGCLSERSDRQPEPRPDAAARRFSSRFALTKLLLRVLVLRRRVTGQAIAPRVASRTPDHGRPRFRGSDRALLVRSRRERSSRFLKATRATPRPPRGRAGQVPSPGPLRRNCRYLAAS